MTPWLQDADVTLYHGDVLDVLAELPSGSVDCVVTSPPYWGLRDYGTGGWEGGDETCDHQPAGAPRSSRPAGGLTGGKATVEAATIHRDVCGRCGARRVDQQLGLEPTPDAYVTRMVEVFREVRRVLAPHGTCWVNLGDSYASAFSCERRNVVGAGSPDPGVKRGNRLVGGLKEKDLVGIPWRVAFALQADGWWLRSDIIWAKPNPMPESVTDRPTKSHEYVFLLTKQPRYYFDAEAVREKAESNGYEHAALRSNEPGWSGNPNVHGEKGHALPGAWTNGGGRNVRSVWTVATQPYPEAHFATYPEELVRRCVLAGCPERVCRVCGKPSERIVETVGHDKQRWAPGEDQYHTQAKGKHGSTSSFTTGLVQIKDTLGWSDCGHNTWRPGTVLDPFVGSGTSCKVARDHGRHSIGIDLSQEYLALAARRLQQQSLFSEASA